MLWFSVMGRAKPRSSQALTGWRTHTAVHGKQASLLRPLLLFLSAPEELSEKMKPWEAFMLHFQAGLEDVESPCRYVDGYTGAVAGRGAVQGQEQPYLPTAVCCQLGRERPAHLGEQQGQRARVPGAGVQVSPEQRIHNLVPTVGLNVPRMLMKGVFGRCVLVTWDDRITEC